jgi:hypothetical protein
MVPAYGTLTWGSGPVRKTENAWGLVAKDTAKIATMKIAIPRIKCSLTQFPRRLNDTFGLNQNRPLRFSKPATAVGNGSAPSQSGLAP